MNIAAHAHVRVVALALLLIAALFPAPAMARFGLDDLSDKDRDQLAMLIDQLAKVEAVFQICARAKNYDAKLRDEVSSCIETPSIQRIQRFFEQRYDAHRKVLDPSVCDTPAVKQNLPKIEAAMEDALDQIGLMCTLCLFC